MELLKITPSKLEGTISNIPSSKSFAHRAITCAMLSNGKSEINNVYFSEDVLATLDAVRILGSDIKICGNKVIIEPKTQTPKYAEINCRESASTLRFLVPVFAALGIKCKFIGEPSLSSRPISPLIQCLEYGKVHCISSGGLPLEIDGKLQPGSFKVPGSVSSQFISGLLFALPILKKDSDIVITSKIESMPYINMTINTLEKFGITIEKTPLGFHVPGNQTYQATNFCVDSDWSQAAFFMSAGALGAKVSINNMNLSSIQGDIEVLNILKRFGGKLYNHEGSLSIQAQTLHGIDIDASQIPDLVPILAVVASAAKGKTHIYGANRLRFKECNRLKAIKDALNEVGGCVKEFDDGLIIYECDKFHGGTVETYGDHRIIMSMAIASIYSDKPIYIKDFGGVKKSYPTFFKDFKSIGGIIDVVNLGK